MEIPLNINEQESLARIILHSFHYSESKGKIRPEAFIPSPSEIDEISLLRYIYTNSDFCKQHGLNIAHRKNTPVNPCKFIGIAILLEHEINAISESTSEVSCQVFASPLDNQDAPRADSPILTTDSGFPMHAHIKYSFKVEQDKPISQYVKQHVAKRFCNIAQSRFFKDVNLDEQNWSGDVITIV